MLRGYSSVSNSYLVTQSKKNTQAVSPHNSNALLQRSNYTHARSMPVGNLRTAANDERDDDPRALRPIPIATKDAVSFVEKNTPPGQNAEVVRFLCFSPTSRFDHHRRFRMMSMMRIRRIMTVMRHDFFVSVLYVWRSPAIYDTKFLLILST